MCFCFFNISTLFSQSNRVYFPHTPNFHTGSAPIGWTLANGAEWNIDGLQLTSNIKKQFGAAALDLASFDVTHDITIQFDYSMIGPSNFNDKGDGFSFFFIRRRQTFVNWR